MLVDTSALLAILQSETEHPAYNRAIEPPETRALSIASFVELSMVLQCRCGPGGNTCGTSFSGNRPDVRRQT